MSKKLNLYPWKNKEQGEFGGMTAMIRFRIFGLPVNYLQFNVQFKTCKI
jgi:hypothetical protein